MSVAAHEEPNEPEGALNQLLEGLYPRLVLWCAARISLKLKQRKDLDGLARDLLARLGATSHSFMGQDYPSFLAWVFQVAERAVLDAERFYTPGGDPLPKPSHSIELERLKQAISSLSTGQREVIRLRRFEELSHAEVAERMGCTEAAVRVLYVDALKSLWSAIPPE
jgi:DNA-directed RNA polymerase specialized sigma24 family protein